jgi:hypothetical protein
MTQEEKREALKNEHLAETFPDSEPIGKPLIHTLTPEEAAAARAWAAEQQAHEVFLERVFGGGDDDIAFPDDVDEPAHPKRARST